MLLFSFFFFFYICRIKAIQNYRIQKYSVKLCAMLNTQISFFRMILFLFLFLVHLQNLVFTSKLFSNQNILPPFPTFTDDLHLFINCKFVHGQFVHFLQYTFTEKVCLGRLTRLFVLLELDGSCLITRIDLWGQYKGDRPVKPSTERKIRPCHTDSCALINGTHDLPPAVLCGPLQVTDLQALACVASTF